MNPVRSLALRRGTWPPVAGALAVAAALSGCGSGAAHSAKAAAPRYAVEVGSPSGVGRALVDGSGFTLYMFVPDHHLKPTCYATCAVQWPPLLLPAGVHNPRAGHGVDARLLGADRRTDGRLQVTYNHWPLYLWFGDVKPGMATGQGLDNLGGYWYAMSPDGQPIK